MAVEKKFEEQFTMIPNKAIHSGMSLKAIGLLAFLLSLPDDGEYSIEKLYKALPDGKTSVQSGIHELEEHGMLVRTQSRDNGMLSGAVWKITL